MVAVVVAGDATEAIPLLNESLTVPGKYDRGRNNITEFAQHWLGMQISKASNDPSQFRNGIIAPASHISGVIVDGQVQSTGGAGTQAVHVLAYRGIVNRAGRGPYLVTQQANLLSLPMPAADGSNARIDLVCVMPYDKGAFPSDAQHGPKYVVVTGDPSGSPVVPALPAAVSEAIILAQVSRPANDNQIAAADITDVRKSCGLHGTPRVLLWGDLLTDVGAYPGELRMRVSEGTNRFVPSAMATAGAKVMIDYWDAVNATWRGVSPGSVNIGPHVPAGPQNGIAHNVTVTLSTVTIPDPGYPYRLRLSAELVAEVNAGQALSYVIRDGGTGGPSVFPSTGGFLINRNGDTVAGASAGGRYAYPTGVSDILSGAKTLFIRVTGIHTAGGTANALPGFYSFEIVPA